MAKDAQGREVDPLDPAAVCWDIAGALRREAGSQSEYVAAVLALADVLGTSWLEEPSGDAISTELVAAAAVCEVNDYEGHAAILDALDRAIRATDTRGATTATLDVLREARALLGDRPRWTPSAPARKADGQAVFPDDPGAVCWSLTGAIRFLARDETHATNAITALALAIDARETLRDGPESVVDRFTDATCTCLERLASGHGHGAMLTALDRAITNLTRRTD